MAKLHYIINSRKRAQIKKMNPGKVRIIIDDVVTIKENGDTKLDFGTFQNNENKKKKFTFIDCFTTLMYSIAIILLVLILILLGIGKDCNILNSTYIDNIIGIVALLFGISSIPRIKEFFGKNLTGPRICNKLWYVVMILCLPFYIVIFMDWIGLSNSVSNICGIIGIIISILTW